MKIFWRNLAFICNFFLLALFISGCKKALTDIQVPESEYYFRCKIDGVEKKFKIPDSAYLPESKWNGIYSFAAGGVDDLSTLNQMSLCINDGTNNPIVEGKTYKTVITGGITQVQSWITYANLTGDYYYSALTQANPPFESAEIVLTEIADTYVKGKFKGKLLVDENVSATVKFTIADGEFYLPRSKKALNGVAATGDGHFEGNINGKSLSIKESADGLNMMYAYFENGESGGKNYYFLQISGFSNILLNTATIVNLGFISNHPFAAGETILTYNSNTVTGIPFSGSIQYKDNGGNLITYSGSITKTLFDLGVNGKATINITKFSTKKGDYIEGEVLIENAFFLPSSVTKGYSLTGGKFRAKVDD